MSIIAKPYWGQRFLDLVLTLPGLLILAPLMCLVAVVVRVKLGSPVIFTQMRTGLGGTSFKIYKFRSMINASDTHGNLLADELRLTRFGHFLRATSLDELPELFNVLKGEMSLVGPRPLYPKYMSFYSNREQVRHSVLPGITGWAQIHGRNYLSWDKRLALDVWYVEHRSLWLYLTILFKTVRVVLARDGVATDPDTVEIDLDVERGEKDAALVLTGGGAR